MSKKYSSFDSYRVIMSTLNGFKQFSVRSLLFEQTSNNHGDLYIDDRRIHDPIPRVVVDSCNGLILLNNFSEDLFLWNPTIREASKLPSIDTDKWRKHVHGFGFDESNDDYKVATIVKFSEVDHKCNLTGLKSSVYIYSLKTDCWKMFRDFEGEIGGTSIKFANGKFYWGYRSGIGSNVKWFIVSLDLDSGVYEKVDLPDYREGELKFDPTFGLMGGCISVYFSYGDEREALWVLKTEGSWSKVFEFNFRDLKTPIVNAVSRLVSLSMLPNGEILLAYMKCFVIYKPIDKSFKIHINERYPIYGADLYVESLVSPLVPLSMLPNGEILLACEESFVIYNPIDKAFRIHINDPKLYCYPVFGVVLYVESLVSPVANGRMQCEATSLKKEDKGGSRPDSGLELSSRFPISDGFGLILISLVWMNLRGVQALMDIKKSLS